MDKIGFGGGCHWCTEGVFQALRGVHQVEQGFIQSSAPADTWAEGVVVTFDPALISLAVLSEVHLRTHSATRARPVRSKYRSAIYIFAEEQREIASHEIAELAQDLGKPVHTLVIPFVGLEASEARFQNYYRTDPTRPFCRTYIDPKLAFIRQRFGDLARPSTCSAYEGGRRG